VATKKIGNSYHIQLANNASEFMHLINQINKDTIEKLLDKYSILKQNIMIPDFCRWVQSDCPAYTMNRLVIRETDIYSCIHGDKIATIDDNMDWVQVKQEFEKRRQDIIKQRKCELCAAYNSCSKCMAIMPDDVLDYCTAQRNLLKSKLKIIYNIKNIEYFGL